ncbi:MAG: DNA polymerase III subunit gamma/tau [Planctomycetota bacterium]
MEDQGELDVAGTGYTVVARRYRPKNFDELIGQDHIAQALNRAIESGRVGHAYLFTGARGVGKTSTARIFAKALNIAANTDPTLAADVAAAIDSGEDIDVIEIDGASNRGIEEIRQLRANVNVRPSRSTYKIYIIDEVHMLTNQAFNALLKTLEEPPPHVKFIFCTTDPDKIPITVLSRCQRFDFAPVQLEAIQSRLKEISECEGYEADEEALALLARRAAGSMRDSQSLLEQVMSFSVDRISVEQVHELLGTADESRLQGFVETLIEKDRLQVLTLVDEAVREGADAGQLAEQLLGYLRDLMAVAIGGGPDLLKLANPVSHGKMKEMTEVWGLQTILSAVQILDESLVRMRSSISAVTLLEVALVQICDLENIASIPALLEKLESGQLAKPSSPARAPQKKNVDAAVAASPPAPPQEFSSLPAKASQTDKGVENTPKREVGSEKDESDRHASASEQAIRNPKVTASEVKSAGNAPKASENSESASATSAAKEPEVASDSFAMQQWRKAITSIDGMLVDYASMASAVEAVDSQHWKVTFPPGRVAIKEFCEQPEKKTELLKAVELEVGRSVALTFQAERAEIKQQAQPVSKTAQRAQRLREISNDPYVKKLCEVLEGEILRVDPPKATNVAGPSSAATSGAAKS